MNLFVPAGETWTIEMTLSRKGLAYLKSHRRVRGFLSAEYVRGHGKNASVFQLDGFRVTVVG